MCCGLNWFLLIVSYILGIGFTILTIGSTVVVIFGALADGVCTGAAEGTEALEDQINELLKALHDFLCNNSAEGTDCGQFPESIEAGTIDEFCAEVNTVVESGAKIFGFMILVVIAQWTFVAIQRANLVEGAARRGFAKEKIKEKEDGTE